MKKEKYFSLRLEDYALPGFVSGEKTYFGTLSDIDNFMLALRSKCGDSDFHAQTLNAYELFRKGKLKVTHTVAYNQRHLMDSINVLDEKSFGIANDIRWTHLNIYGFPYYMKADSCAATHIWLFDGARYMRCVKPSFENLSYSVSEDEGYTPVRVFWGYPEVLFCDNAKHNFVSSRLFLPEKYFTSEAEMKENIRAFTGEGNYTEFCNEIFADG